MSCVLSMSCVVCYRALITHLTAPIPLPSRPNEVMIVVVDGIDNDDDDDDGR